MENIITSDLLTKTIKKINKNLFLKKVHFYQYLIKKHTPVYVEQLTTNIERIIVLYEAKGGYKVHETTTGVKSGIYETLTCQRKPIPGTFLLNSAPMTPSLY